MFIVPDEPVRSTYDSHISLSSLSFNDTAERVPGDVCPVTYSAVCLCIAVKRSRCKVTNKNRIAQMKVVELLKIGGELLKLMSKHDVLRDDYRYVPMFEEYQNLRRNGLKHHAAITMLSNEYHVSTRTIERIIKRLKCDC